MTSEQITNYEYCKDYLECIKEIKEKLPFKIQQFGCASQSPRIEHTLEAIHKHTFVEVIDAINTAQDQVQKIIIDT